MDDKPQENKNKLERSLSNISPEDSARWFATHESVRYNGRSLSDVSSENASFTALLRDRTGIPRPEIINLYCWDVPHKNLPYYNQKFPESFGTRLRACIEDNYFLNVFNHPYECRRGGSMDKCPPNFSVVYEIRKPEPIVPNYWSDGGAPGSAKYIDGPRNAPSSATELDKEDRKRGLNQPPSTCRPEKHPRFHDHDDPGNAPGVV